MAKQPWFLGTSLILAAHCACAEGEFLAFGHLSLGLADSAAPSSWTEGGVGRYLHDDKALGISGHLGLNWQSDLTWELMLHARALSNGAGGETGRVVGLVEAYGARNVFLADGSRFRFKLGQFFLPSSREATDPLWQSPYHLNLSALNAWIAEEYRPIGLDASWRTAADAEHEIELGATLFGGNDSAGALLAWRGYAAHDRLSVLGEVLALPPLPTLDSDFAGQRDDGSKPFGADLDGRAGYALRARFGQPDRYRFLLGFNDNRGDRHLHRGEYAWATRFWQIGAEWHVSESWTLLAEHQQGRSGMGLESGAHVDIDFDASYLIASWQFRPDWRLSLRAERFNIDDRDGVSEPNGDSGRGLTATLFFQPQASWRLGLEWSSLNTEHAASVLLPAPAETGGRQWRLEARYLF